MCRSTIEGGRRCPSHTNPELVKAYNAKRRERYHLKKTGAFGQPETSHAGEPVASAANPSIFNHPLFRDSSQYSVGGETALQELNITQEEAKGKLVDRGYMSSVVTHGIVNYNHIKEDSWKTFGFKDPNESYNDVNSYTVDEMKEFSKLELEGFSSEETHALRYFTGASYQWLNEALYSGEIDKATSKDSVFPEEDDSWGIGSVPKDENTLHQVCNAIDSAMQKGPKKQRIVYRGMNMYNTVIGYSMGDTDDDARKNASDWAKNNFKLGQEVKFDGYQSSTPDATSAFAYAYDGGVVFEILTSEGVNVTKISHFDYEKEILLPRDARYMVVGNHQANVTKPFPKKFNVVQLVAINEQGAVLDGTNASPYAPLPKAK